MGTGGAAAPSPQDNQTFPASIKTLRGLHHSYKANCTHVRLTQVLGSETLDLGVVGHVAPSWG